MGCHFVSRSLLYGIISSVGAHQELNIIITKSPLPPPQCPGEQGLSDQLPLNLIPFIPPVNRVVHENLRAFVFHCLLAQANLQKDTDHVS